MTKKCKGCGLFFDLSAFPVNARNKDGRDIRCKPCCADKTRAWRTANPESAAASEKRWRDNNPDKAKVNAQRRNARWRAAHPGVGSWHTKQWRAKNPEIAKEKSRQWSRDNPEKCARKSSERRAATFRAIPPWLSEEDRALITEKFLEAKRLSRETGVKHHVDHIVPLKGKTVRGLHVPWNLQVIPASVNHRKWNKIIEATP